MENNKQLSNEATVDLFLDWAKKELLNSKELMKTIIHSYEIDFGVTLDSGLGYFPAGHDSIKRLISFFEKKNKSKSDLIAANILNTNNSIIYSKYEERIIVPLKMKQENFPENTKLSFIAIKFIKEDERIPILGLKKSIEYENSSYEFEIITNKQKIINLLSGKS